MNAVEKLEAAIAKLEVLREAARGGPWSAWHSEDPRGNSAVEAPTHDEDNPWLVVDGEAPDVDLIVTLHRTIDPQLAILREARDLFNERLDFRAEMSDEWRAEHHPDPAQLWPADIQPLALAESILGVSDADVG